MRRNYHRKLSASIYHHTKKCGNYRDTGVSKKRKREIRRVPFPFIGKQDENCLYNVGKSLGERLAEAKIP